MAKTKKQPAPKPEPKEVFPIKKMGASVFTMGTFLREAENAILATDKSRVDCVRLTQELFNKHVKDGTILQSHAIGLTGTQTVACFYVPGNK